MSVPKLTYFDLGGGRGEVARLAFAIGAVRFVDDRVPFAAWKDRKVQTPFGALPVHEIIPSDLADRVTPRPSEHCERIRSLPEVKTYSAARQAGG